MEGIMLVSALAGVIVSAYTQSAWVGLLGAVLSGTLIAGILAFFHLKNSRPILFSAGLRSICSPPAVQYLFCIC
ncbi:hypothetical protein ACFSQ7_08495 [Paenibacillus rhizoplanae]